MSVSKETEALIATGATSRTIEAQARSEGMRLLIESGLDLVHAGRTTLDEIERVIGDG